MQDTVSVRIHQLEVRGFISANLGIANFLGIPFARIPARFRQAIIVDPQKESGIVDASCYGHRCPQPLDVIHSLTRHLYNYTPSVCPQSEFSCLNLNIYTPPATVIAERKFPVLVWIHGGGWTYGDGGGEFDGNFLVRRSISIGKPIVVVSLNYRLGYFGFLSSQELRDEARRNGEIGYVNQGLEDQRIGFRWIQQNIHHFGGDGLQLTAAGESAGAWSILAHLRSDFPAFQQAFLMSCPSLTPLPASEHQRTFDRLVASTGVSTSATPDDKLAALRRLSPKGLELLLLEEGNAIPGWDEKFWADQDPLLPLEQGPFPPWVKVIVVGTTKDEFALFSQFWYTLTAKELLHNLRSQFTDLDFAEEVLEAYGINDRSKETAIVEACIQYVSDCFFGRAAYEIASQHDSHPICLYTFDEVDGTECPFKGTSYHSIDSAFLFHLSPVAGPIAPPSWRATADAYSRACIDLTYGEQPWESYLTAKRAMSFNGKMTGLTKNLTFSRWIHLISSKKRADMFASGKALLFDAINYGMKVNHTIHNGVTKDKDWEPRQRRHRSSL